MHGYSTRQDRHIKALRTFLSIPSTETLHMTLYKSEIKKLLRVVNKSSSFRDLPDIEICQGKEVKPDIYYCTVTKK